MFKRVSMRQLTACERQLAACERQLAACERQLAVGPQARNARTADAERWRSCTYERPSAPCELSEQGMGRGTLGPRPWMPLFFAPLISPSCALFLQLKDILPEVRLLRYFGRMSLLSEFPWDGVFPQREGFLLFWCEEFFRFYLRSRRMASLRPASSAERM